MRDTTRVRAPFALLCACALAALLAPSALAVPFHPRDESRDVTGLNHACGAAVDSKGDLYLSSAGESKVKVYDSSHNLLTSISDANGPCGLALTTAGDLYVSEQATGNVVKFHPSEYPPTGSTTYTETTIDSSGKAKGIAVDRSDNRLYVAEGDRVSSYGAAGKLGIDEIQRVFLFEATGGEFTLTFGVNTTAGIAFGSSAEVVKTALEALPSIGAGNVSVEKTSETVYFVTFAGALGHADVAPMTGDGSKLTGGVSPSVSISETEKGWSGRIGEGTLTEASGVAAYTYPTVSFGTDRYLSVADAKGLAADRLYVFGGAEVRTLKVRREVTGAATPDGSFGFGTAGAQLAADPGNRDSEGKCPASGEQACTAGHLFLYDAAHKALDEFDATGEFLDRTRNAAFADAEPTALAIDRSGTSGDGTLYVTAGSGAGAKALAFGPLKAPSRATLGEPISKILATANAVATDSRGYVYVTTGSLVHVFKPDGTEILTAGKAPIEDKQKPWDLAVDSTCKVYVLDKAAEGKEEDATYYTPSACPPVNGTTYSRHEPPVAASKDFPTGSKSLRAIAVDPGPGVGKDRLFLTSGGVTRVYKSALEGSGLLDEAFAPGVSGIRQSLAVDGVRGIVYIGTNPSLTYGVDEATGKTILTRIKNTCPPSGKFSANPFVAVDQSNGHLLEFDKSATVREYDAAGSCVAEFGSFTENLPVTYRVAVDSACALHEPPLSGEACKAFDPADGNVYLAYDDTNAAHPPYDVTAFGPLTYATPVKRKLTVKRTGSGSGKVTSEPAGIDCGSTCSAEFDETEVVTLTAKAGTGSKFVGWEGCEAEETVSPTEGACEVTMSKDREVAPEFEKVTAPEFPLEVSVEGSGSGEVTSEPSGIECPKTTCSAEFVELTTVTLTAEPDPGSEFEGWQGCDSEPSPIECELTMSSPRMVKAEFGPEHPLLTVVKKGPGSVTSSPPGIECDPTCSAQFDLDEEVTLTAEPEGASEFEGWEGCDAEPLPTECEVTMDEPRQVTATFVALPQAIAKPAHPIAYTEATLRGEIDTVELPTEYRFEYLTEEEYEDNGGGFEGALSTPMGELPPAKTPTAVEAHLLGLQEGTEYRFRLRAMNSVGPAEGEGAFETLQRRASPCANAAYRGGLSANLPDCRAYELVTPADTGGGEVFSSLTRLSLGDGFNNLLTAPRGSQAGNSLSYLTTVTLPGFEGSGSTDGYRSERGAGPHPEAGWSTELVSPTYAQGEIGAFGLGGSSDQLYSLWEIFPQYGLEGGLADGTYLRTPEGFEPAAQGSLGEDLTAKGQYVGTDGAHVLVSSKAHLEGGAAPNGTEAIYSRKAGEASAEVVSVKPGGGSFGVGEGATYLGASEDGAAVAFRVGGVLYLHRQGQTAEVVGGGATYAGVSEDGGDRLFFVKEGALWVFEAGVQTKIAKGGEATFVNVSADGSHAFFTSTAVLTGSEENENHEHAEAGEHNLYTWDGSGTHFVAILDSQDLIGFGEGSGYLGIWTEAILAGSESGLAESPARSTPDGGVFVFQSHARLTAYDNEGVGEIYRYAPAAPSGERLRCVSCDPTGTPPGGEAALLENTVHTVGFDSGIDRKTVIPNVTDDGEAVFFQSPDRLLPEDSNEVEDVYEWRAKGSGSPECTRSAGCLALISSGQGETASLLYAMSADGHDVFFKTREKLVGSDILGSPSFYDAREGGGIPEAVETAPCQGDACQGQGSEPPPLPAPATTGAGEEARPQAWPCGKGRHRVRGRCVKRHVSKHHRRAKHHRHRHRRTHR